MSGTVNDLINVISWAHKLLAEVIKPGDFAIDLTAGRGHDTLWLAQQVDAIHQGQVLAFDLQQTAIDSTAERLDTAGFLINEPTEPLASTAGITLSPCCHSRLAELIDPRIMPHPKAVIANFGYLPNGDHTTTTNAQTSCDAINQAIQLLAARGRIALVLYTGHDGATEEVEAIENLCNELDGQTWNVLRVQPVNRNNAPYLLVIEKK
ncbi:MAG: class I SAM-dependent methyltransferase [Deltaproteobacteria bacterium]|nr:class I SAM-dependent methyltransferase [Deltaproteobacteria bacterium]